jgi:hypothetical protein
MNLLSLFASLIGLSRKRLAPAAAPPAGVEVVGHITPQELADMGARAGGLGWNWSFEVKKITDTDGPIQVTFVTPCRVLRRGQKSVVIPLSRRKRLAAPSVN